MMITLFRKVRLFFNELNQLLPLNERYFTCNELRGLTSAKKSAAVVFATTSSRALFAHGPSHTPRARYIERTRPPAALDTRPSPAFAFALRRRRPSSPHFSYRV